MGDRWPPARRRPVAALGRLSLLLLGLLATGCAARGFVRPVGAAVPVPAAESDSIWQDAIRACADIRTFNAEVRPSGRVAGSRVRGVTMNVAVSHTGSIGIEAIAATQTVFLLKGVTDRAILLLPSENRVVTAPASEILGAYLGLETDPGRLLAIFSGCITTTRQARRVERIGETVRVETPDAVVYLRQGESGWRPVAGEFDDLLVDYRRVEADRPVTIGLRTTAGRQPAVDLSLSVRDAVLNSDLPAEAFTIAVPPGAVDTPVADLRVLGSE